MTWHVKQLLPQRKARIGLADGHAQEPSRLACLNHLLIGGVKWLPRSTVRSHKVLHSNGCLLQKVSAGKFCEDQLACYEAMLHGLSRVCTLRTFVPLKVKCMRDTLRKPPLQVTVSGASVTFSWQVTRCAYCRHIAKAMLKVGRALLQ